MDAASPDRPSAGTVIVLTSDLAVASMVRGAAERTDAACVTALDADSLFRRLDEIDGPALVIVHLETRGLEIAPLLERIRTSGKGAAAVIAFGPHVHEAKLDAARRAGCDQVLSKGAFHSRVDELIANHLGRQM